MDYDTLDRLNVRQSRAGASRPSVAGGRADFEGIVRTHGSMVYRLALVQTRNRADAEDVFQDVFVALVRRMTRGGRGFESTEHVRAWLLRATVDRGRDLARAARRQRTRASTSSPPNWPRVIFVVRPTRSVALSSTKKRRCFGVRLVSCRPNSAQPCTCFMSRD